MKTIQAYGGKAQPMVSIEFHPENGRSPHVVVWKMGGRVLWFASRTREDAEAKVKEINSEAINPDGIVEMTESDFLATGGAA